MMRDATAATGGRFIDVISRRRPTPAAADGWYILKPKEKKGPRESFLGLALNGAAAHDTSANFSNT